MNKDKEMDLLNGKKYNIITFGCQMNEHDSGDDRRYAPGKGLCRDDVERRFGHHDHQHMQCQGKRRQEVFRHTGAAQEAQGEKSRIRRMRMRMHDAAAAHHRHHQEQISLGGYYFRDPQHTQIPGTARKSVLREEKDRGDFRGQRIRSSRDCLRRGFTSTNRS